MNDIYPQHTLENNMINNIKKCYLYIYYRCFRFYKRYGDSNPGWMSVMVISLMHVFYLNLSYYLAGNFIDYGDRKSNLPLVKVIAVVIMAVLLAFNLLIFRNVRVEKLYDRWANESENLRLKRGWLVVGIIFSPLIIFLGIVSQR